MSAVKALQQWCKGQCRGYRDVSITNMTTSFRDGLAFCALIHKNRPELIDFDSLKKEDVYENNELAFRVAEQLGIPALLDAEDMVALRVPDRLSILTYVSQYYNYFHGRSPIGGLAGIKRPAEVDENEPSGKKNLPVVAKSFPASKPAAENRPPASSAITTRGSSPARPASAARKEELHENPSLSQTGTLSNKCVSCHKRVHLVERHLVDGRLYHRNCAKATLKANAPLRDLLQKASSKHKSHPETPEPSKSTSAALNSDSSWLATKKQPSSSSSPAPSGLTNKTEQTSSPSPAPSWTANKVLQSSSPSPTPSGLTNKTQQSCSPSPAPSWTTNKVLQSSSPSPAPSGLTNKTPRSCSPSPAPSWTTNKVLQSSSPSPAPSGLNNKAQRSRSPSPAPSWTANKVLQSSSPSPAPSGLTNKTPRSRSPSPAPSWTTNKVLKSSSLTPASSGLTNKTQRSTPLKSIFSTTITTTTTTSTPTINTSINTSINTTPIRITINAVPIEMAASGTPSGPTAVPRTSTAAQRTQQAKLRFLQKEPEEATVTVKDVKSAATKDSWWNKVWTPVKSPGANVQADQDQGPGGGGTPGASKTQAAAFIVGKLAKESDSKDTKPTWKTDGVSEVETPKKDPAAPPRGRVKLKVDRSLLSDVHDPCADRSPDGTIPAGSGPPQADPTPKKGHTLSPSRQEPESNEGPTLWRSKLKAVTKDTKIPDPQKPSPAGKDPASELCVGPASNKPPVPGFMNGSRAPRDSGATAEARPLTNKPEYIPKEKILEELQAIEDGLNELEERGVELEKRLRHSEDEGEEDAAMDEVMVDWFSLIREKQVAIRRESELVYIAKTQDLEEQQPSVDQELRRLMEKPEKAKTYWERNREKELMDKHLEIVNDRNAIVEGLDEDRLREDEEDQQLEQMMMNFDIKKDKSKKKSPMSKFFSRGTNNK